MPATRFEGEGPVARYWLANCEGFAVRGDARGVVEALIHDRSAPHVTTRLVVRTRRRGRTIVPAEAVAAVVPADRVLIVADDRERAVEPRSASVGAAVRGRARAAAGLLATAGPPARTAAVQAQRRLALLAAAAWPRLRPAAFVAAGSLVLLGRELRATCSLLAGSCLRFAHDAPRLSRRAPSPRARSHSRRRR